MSGNSILVGVRQFPSGSCSAGSSNARIVVFPLAEGARTAPAYRSTTIALASMSTSLF